MKEKLKIVDYHCHSGHQYEFHKTGHEFHLIGANSEKPNWDINDRPLLPNVKLVSESEAHREKYDVAIIRSPIDIKRYERFLKCGAKPIAVVQTITPQKLPKYVYHVVWNCEDSMKKYSKTHFPRKNHYHIIHGFDPNEFKNLHLEKKDRVLTVANVFKKRGYIMGFDLWESVQKELGICDLVGHGNEDLKMGIKRAATFEELVKIYNSYKIFFNSTRESANPRSRGEAAMCGAAAIISTSRFDVKNYFKHNKSIIFADSSADTIAAINKLLKEPNFCEDLAHQAREVAIKNFHINDYINKWNRVFKSL